MASISVEGPASAGAPAADHHLSDEKTQMLELLGITQELSSEVNAGKSIAEELDAYKREPALPLFDHNGNYSDPLPWWKQRALRYPRLHALALQTLQIQATSASSERAFSSAGLTIRTNDQVCFHEMLRCSFFSGEHGILRKNSTAARLKVTKRAKSNYIN